MLNVERWIVIAMVIIASVALVLVVLFYRGAEQYWWAGTLVNMASWTAMFIIARRTWILPWLELRAATRTGRK